MSNRKVIGVDIGNSSIKTAEFFDADIGEIRKWKDLQALAKAYPNAHFVVSSVGMRVPKIMGWLDSSFMVNAKTRLPIEINYETPDTLGPDRIAAAVGAHHLFPKKNILIIDGGTCITYDLVTEMGIYIGGIISPGLEMRLQAMHHFTNSLPLTQNRAIEPKIVVGKSTTECMLLGAQGGLKHEIEGFLEYFNNNYDHLQVVITGGIAPHFESNLKARIFANSKIVLIGLHVIWKFNEST